MAGTLTRDFPRTLTRAAIVIAASVLLPACGGGGGGSDSQSPPTISNLTMYPTALYVDSQSPFGGSFDFTDPDGDLASATLEILSSTGTVLQSETIPISGVSGMKSGTVEGSVEADTSTAGTFGVRVYVLDRQGLRSNTLTASIRISEFPWVARTPMPLPRQDFATAVLDGKIYVLGGGDTTYLGYPKPPTTTVQVYDPATDSWYTDTPMLVPVTNHVAATIDDMIHVAGGASSTSPGIKTLQVREPAFGIWMQKADMPSERVDSAATVNGGKLLVFGGRDPGMDSSSAFAYDPALDQWSSRARMPDARSRHRAITVDGKSIVLGGYSGGTIDGYTKTVYEYDFVADAWTQLADMPWPPLQDFGIGLFEGSVYTAGGSNWEPALKTVRAYDPVTDQWSGKTEMPLALAWPSAEMVNGKMYVFDGNNTLEYTPANDIL